MGYFITLKQFFMIVVALAAVFVALILLIVRSWKKSK
jgi:hypothetical protein